MPLFRFADLSRLVRSPLNGSAAALKLADCCAICLDAFAATCVVRRLRVCGHVLHAECLGRWLQQSESCPLCKRDTGLYGVVEHELKTHPKVLQVQSLTLEYG